MGKISRNEERKQTNISRNLGRFFKKKSGSDQLPSVEK